MSESQKQKDIRTAIARARGLGSAKDGVKHWWMQRVSSVALLPLSLYWLAHIKDIADPDYNAFITFIGDPFVSIFAILFIATAFYHALLGMQVIIEDYVHGKGAKIACLMLNKLAFCGMGIACIFAIAYINFALYGRPV